MSEDLNPARLHPNHYTPITMLVQDRVEKEKQMVESAFDSFHCKPKLRAQVKNHSESSFDYYFLKPKPTNLDLSPAVTSLIPLDH